MDQNAPLGAFGKPVLLVTNAEATLGQIMFSKVTLTLRGKIASGGLLGEKVRVDGCLRVEFVQHLLMTNT